MKEVITVISFCLLLGSHFPAIAGGPEPRPSDIKNTEWKGNEYQVPEPNGRGRETPKSVIDGFNPTKNNKARPQYGAPIQPQQAATDKSGKLILKLTPQEAEELHRKATEALRPDRHDHPHHHCSNEDRQEGQC